MSEYLNTLIDIVKAWNNSPGKELKLKTSEDYPEWLHNLITTLKTIYADKACRVSFKELMTAPEGVVLSILADTMQLGDIRLPVGRNPDAEAIAAIESNKAKAVKEFKNFDRLLKTFIIQACHVHLSSNMKSCQHQGRPLKDSESGRECYESIQVEFKTATGDVALYAAKAKLERLKQKEGESVTKYYERLQKLLSRIVLIGGATPDLDSRRHFLHGLRNELVHIGMQILATPFTSLSSDLNTLLSCEAMYAKSNRDGDAEQAKYAKAKAALKKKKDKERKETKCSYCQYPGHVEDKCWKKRRDHQEGNDSSDESSDENQDWRAKYNKEKADRKKLEAEYEKRGADADDAKKAKNIFSGRTTKAKNSKLYAVKLHEDCSKTTIESEFNGFDDQKGWMKVAEPKELQVA